MSDPKVGEFLSAHVAAGWKKQGTFTIEYSDLCMNLPKSHKVGGNVVAYFCTPDLEILHAVWGPEEADSFLQQARWAVGLWEKIRKEPPVKQFVLAREAHEANPFRNRGMWTSAGVEQRARYDHLMAKILMPLEQSAAELFRQLVNEETSSAPVRHSSREFGNLNFEAPLPIAPPSEAPPAPRIRSIPRGS